jgi:MFS transporter, DHA1 family, multidrug resistance protein
MRHRSLLEPDTKTPPSGKSGRTRLAILFVTLVVIMLGFGMIIPILPFYVDKFDAGGFEMGLLMATFAAMQFLFAPVWGQLSDRYGRKPILVLGVLGNALSQLLFGLSTALWMLIASRALAGILSSATLPTAMAYIGDSTSDEERGGGMGILGAAMGVGMVLGPFLGGPLGERSLSLPFFLAAGLSVAVVPFILLVLPESLGKEARTQGNTLRGPQLGKMWQALFSPIGVLLVLSLLLSFGLTNFEAVFGLFALRRYGYGPEQVGLILGVIGLTSAAVQGALTGPFTRRWGEAAVIRASLGGSVVGFLIMLQARNYAGVLITVSLFILSNAMLRPAVASLISRRTTSGQGVAMGLHNSFMSLGRVFGPLWAGFVFDLDLSLPYISGSLVMALGFVLSVRRLSSGPARPELEVAPEPEAIHET